MYTDRVRRRMRRGKLEDIGEVYLAQDSDFVNVYGFWIYKGAALEVEIPTHINGELVTSTQCMFNGSATYQATPVTKVVLKHSNVTDMNSMFRNSSATTLDLASFDTSNVTDMSRMFENSSATTLDLSGFDTSNVTNMNSMFQYSSATSLDLSNFNTSNVTDMSYMFFNSSATSLDLSNFDTSNVTTMRSMFFNSKATTLDLSSFDTSNVIDMQSTFSWSSARTLDLSSFDTSNVTDMNSMFRNSSATTLDLSSFDTSNVTDMSRMFENSSATTGYARTQADADNFNSSNNRPEGLVFKAVYKDGVYLAQDSDFVNVNGYWVYKGVPLEVDITDFVNSKNLTSTRYMFSGSATHKSTAVKRVVLGKNSVTDMYAMFHSSQATSLDLSSFDTSRVTNMIIIFEGSRATSLDLSSFDTSSVIYMSNMFRGSQATIGYARTQADADKFNSSSNKPEGLVFVVK